MEIEYMQQMVKNPKLYGFVNEGMNLEEIKHLESVYNYENRFPKAFREYLYLGGNFSNIPFDDWGKGFEAMQKRMLKDLADENQSTERPFFAFDNTADCYLFIYLDEEVEDPNVYVFIPFAETFDMEFIKPNGYTFSEFVNETIHRIKNDIPM
ncbi:hypothetical protein [Kordia zhangzhouensis]|uniref:hypothetical protein n=1 Tax=Kordia zhangzhouensis TaxID=1620405 RepID=UPI00062961FF|nr:hypothetical protein [Kordia zhangzhouensis]